jgi:hypothetical protein
MSYASSAGIAGGAPGYGKTRRKDVLGGVDVPVVPGAAGRAAPVPGGQAQVREQVPTRRAGLGRRVPAADHDQVAAIPLALVLQLAAELAPAAVRDGAGQMPVADHAANVEVFDDDGVGRADQAGAGAVQEVSPRVADLAVRAGDRGRGPGPVGRPFPAAGQAPLVPCQPCPLLLVRVRPAPVCRPHPRRIARLIEKLREPRYTSGYLFLSRCAGHPIPPRPEGRGILREAR